VDLGRYFSAGFLVTRRFPRPDFAAADLLPSVLVSGSSDLAAFIPDVWAIAWCGVEAADRRASAARLGIGPERVDAVVAEVTALIANDAQYGWPNVCHAPAAAAVMKRLTEPADDIVLLELALAQAHAARLIQASTPPPTAPGQAPFGEPGVRTALRRGLSPGRDGRPLGIEPLCFDHALGCSWLCNGLEAVVARELGIRPNEAGLIGSAEQAEQAVAYISRDEVGAEPGLWLPWLIIEHSDG
jgi:hypothetical protein